MIFDKNQENSSDNKKIETCSSEEINQTEANSSSEINDQKNQKIAELEASLASVNEKLLRALAENDNLRKRSKEEVEKASKYAISNFANDLVVIVENFYLAVDNMPGEEIAKNASIKNFADAVVMTKKELTKIFEKNGIKRIYPINEKFNYNYHEAVSRIPSDLEEDSIVQIIQAGYLIGDRLIKPALVTVAAKKEEN